MLVGDLTLLKCLGKGAFGEVYLTSKQGSSQKFATKKIDKKFAKNPRAKKYLDNEINILKEIDHPNIIKLYEVHQTTQYYYLVMELCNGGGLSECLEEYKKMYKKAFPEEIVQYLMKQIVAAIYYLHQRHILHRDIKLDNILVNFESEEDKNKRNMSKASIKIIDFGFARHLDPGDLAKSTLGSPINMDPGILRKLNKVENSRNYGYDEKADIWSLGTICYEMLIGECTFDAESMRELQDKIEKGNYNLPTSLSQEVVSFLNGMLQYDLKKRLSAEELLYHKFLTIPYSKFTRINIKRSNMVLNTKGQMSQSVMGIIEAENPRVILNDINPDMIDRDKLEKDKAYREKLEKEKANRDKQKIETRVNNFMGNNGYTEDTEKIKNGMANLNLKDKKINEETIKKEFYDAFFAMNDDFIYIEPKLVPIIPGDDPAVINKVSEFTEDNFQI